MKVSTLSLIAFSILTAGRNAAVSAAGAGGIEVTNLQIDEIFEEHHRVVTDSADPSESRPYGNADNGARGESLIHSNLVSTLQAVAGINPFDFQVQGPTDEWIEVQTTYLSGTSEYHQDHKATATSGSGCDRTLVEDTVAFVVLHENEHAYFENDKMSVPFHKGAFVTFKGSDPHRTVVNKGHVHLLGPFEMKSFAKVGWSPTIAPTPSPTDEPTIAPTDFPTDEPTIAPTGFSGFQCYLRQCLSQGPQSFHYDFNLNTVPFQQELVNLCECVLSGGTKCDKSCGCKNGLAYPELPGSNPFCGCYCACCDEHPSHHTKCPSAITLTHPDGPKRVEDVCLYGGACQTRFDPSRPGTSGLIGVDPLSKEGNQQGFIARFGLAGNFLSKGSLAIFDKLFDQCNPTDDPTDSPTDDPTDSPTFVLTFSTT